MIVPAHVNQRTAANHGAVQLRVAQHGRGRQQPAVAPAFNPEMPRRGDFARDQVAGDRFKILEGFNMVLPQALGVPGRAKLASPANVGQHEHPAALQPQFAVGAVQIFIRTRIRRSQ